MLPPAPWSAIECFLDELPTPLQPQAMRLRMALILEYTSSGLLSTLCQRDFDYPWLSLHVGLLADSLPLPPAAPVTTALFEGMFYTFAAAYTAASMADAGGSFDQTYATLQHTLEEAAVARFASLFPPTAPDSASFWAHYQTSWQAYYQTQPLIAPNVPLRPIGTLLTETANRFILATLGTVGVALATGQTAQLPAWLAWHQQLNLIHTLHRDILAIRRDLQQGRYSYLIARTLQAAGLPLTEARNPEAVLGAMLLTGTLTQIIHECLERLTNCRTQAQALSLPTWVAYIERYTPVWQDLLNLFQPQPHAPKTAPVLRQTFALPEDLLARAIQRAELYLLADLSFRESWEVLRLYSPHQPEATSRAFPVGTLLECLGTLGHCLTSQVDQVFQILDRTHFTYYEGAPPLPDSDDFALLLRLFRFSSQSAELQASLERGLPWLAANVLPNGEVPTFWKHSTNLPPLTPFPPWNDRCLTVTTNVVRGLMDYNHQQYQALIERISSALARRLIQFGLGPLGFYLPPYALWQAFLWREQLQALSSNSALQAQLAQVAAVLLARLIHEKKHPASPQTAAWLTLACFAGKVTPHFEPAWVTTLIKQQRYDGSWDDEPFFLTVHHARQSFWYSSRLITTAFCYQALHTYRNHQVVV